MASRSGAVAGLAEDVGKALLLFAERLRADDEITTAARRPRDAPRSHTRLGATQARLLEALTALVPRG